MPFEWHGLRFEGPLRHPGELEAQGGVYTIWCWRGNGWAILDIGEAGDIRARVLSHDRKDCWRQQCAAEINYAAHYTPGLDETGRRRLETQFRAIEHPPCGEVY